MCRSDRQTDRWTDGRTDRHLAIVRAIHTRRAVKTRVMWLPEGEKRLMICWAVLTEYRRVIDRETDGQTDRQTSCDGIVRAVKITIFDISFYLENGTRQSNSYYEMRIGKPYQSFQILYHFQWLWTTLNTYFKVTPSFDAGYLINGTRYRHSYNGMLIGTYIHPT